MDIDASFTVQHLRSIILHSLDTFNLRNAEFAAERLVAMVPEDHDAVFLYSLTLYRQGKYKAAFNHTSAVLSGHMENLGCAYIFARLCLHLQRAKEGIFCLSNMAHLYNDHANSAGLGQRSSTLPSFGLPSRKHHYESSRSVYPDSSAIYHLLGDLYKDQGDSKNSILNYHLALRYNVFDFEAFQELAKAGADVSVKSLYKHPSHAPVPQETGSLGASPDPDSMISTRRFSSELQPPKANDSILSNPFSTTPRQKHPSQDISTPRVGSSVVPDAPLRRTHGPEANELSRPGFLAPLSRIADNKTPTAGQRSLSYVKRRSDFSQPEAPRNLKRTSSSGLLTTSAESRQSTTKEILVADAYLRQLFSVFAKAYKCFQKYDCYQAIRILESLPEGEQNTAWVLAKLGRLHYEIVNYKQSNRFFLKLRQLDRTRLEDMEYFSTLLWHLNKKVELTYLANELFDIDEHLAITWCVMGNLFSLLREPDEAVKCFNKSLALDPKFTYAHTLKGHEYFSNDNYEKALECFRCSILLDPRHYNAFYGIGMVYINLGEYQKADYHFKKAVAINPINIILICCVGMALEKLGKKTLALRQYELANKLQPLSALPVFKKAQLLFTMQQFPQALEQFEIVKELAPNEASVHFLLGQLYNIQHDKFLAIREFTIALNLDPKGNYLIREAMELMKDQ